MHSTWKRFSGRELQYTDIPKSKNNNFFEKNIIASSNQKYPNPQRFWIYIYLLKLYLRSVVQHYVVFPRTTGAEFLNCTGSNS